MDLIRIRRREGLAFDITVRDRTLSCDMSVSDGGQGAGFAPVDLFAGSLGACIAMVVQGWCDACGHGGDVAVEVAVELVPDPTRIGAIIADVELPAGVPEDRCAAVRRVVEHCVIQQTLKQPPQLDLEVSVGT
jgi:uncharacterized OsmC-like protein